MQMGPESLRSGRSPAGGMMPRLQHTDLAHVVAHRLPPILWCDVYDVIQCAARLVRSRHFAAVQRSLSHTTRLSASVRSTVAPVHLLLDVFYIGARRFNADILEVSHQELIISDNRMERA
jgi:hypothetical protein